jgi:hypothetical protein
LGAGLGAARARPAKRRAALRNFILAGLAKCNVLNYEEL